MATSDVIKIPAKMNKDFFVAERSAADMGCFLKVGGFSCCCWFCCWPCWCFSGFVEDDDGMIIVSGDVCGCVKDEVTSVLKFTLSSFSLTSTTIK